MEKYLVAVMYKDPGTDNEPTDHYYPFVEEVKGKSPKELAEEYYNNLLLDERVYSANICLIVGSTDYDVVEEKDYSIVRFNLMNRQFYTPYCTNNISRDLTGGCSNPRTVFNGEQFVCPHCGWKSSFPKEFIIKYKLKWNIQS